MSEHEIRGLLDEVRSGRLSRRAFVQSMVSLGLTVPVAGQLLAGAGLAQTSPRPASAPTKRGGGGALKALSWDAPSLLNPILALGLKDWNACALFYELDRPQWVATRTSSSSRRSIRTPSRSPSPSPRRSGR